MKSDFCYRLVLLLIFVAQIRMNKPKKKLQKIQSWFKTSWDKQKSKLKSFRESSFGSSLSIDANSPSLRAPAKTKISDTISETEEVDSILYKIKSIGEDGFLEMSQSEFKKLRRILKSKRKNLESKLKEVDVDVEKKQTLNAQIHEIQGMDRFLHEKTLEGYVWSSVLPGIVQMLSLGMVTWQICESVRIAEGGCMGLPNPIERVSGLALLPDDPLSACPDVICGGVSQYDNIRFGSEYFEGKDFEILTEDEDQLVFEGNATDENNRYLIADADPLELDIDLLKSYHLSYTFYNLLLILVCTGFGLVFLSTLYAVYTRRKGINMSQTTSAEFRSSDSSIDFPIS
ncbi:unnamed protein product [Dimorphilus gyrociliatus]|uniref:Uncharacterized protein n=1 Tax=Dimorphilus gyrociliatus TaxID=2664684 RepID=A0A7I8VC14_9ANNE|nr:unnamed protein product [Dimorphilus gyrociliatus]